MPEYLFFQMKRVQQRPLAQIGRRRVYETDYVLEETMSSGEGIVRIKDSNLLSEPSDFLTIEDASMLSGISPSDLKKLCEKRVIVGKKISGVWFIESHSLDTYLNG
jgi:hypothetical protein